MALCCVQLGLIVLYMVILSGSHRNTYEPLQVGMLSGRAAAVVSESCAGAITAAVGVMR